MSGCRNRTRAPISRNPAASAGRRRHAASPSRSAARHSSAASPTGSAAATSSRRRRLLRERLELPQEAAARSGSPAASRRPVRNRRRAPRGQPAGQLEQRQRVAAGLGDDAVAQPHVERPADRRGQQRCARPRRPARHVELAEVPRGPARRSARAPRRPCPPAPRAAGGRRTRASAPRPDPATGRRRSRRERALLGDLGEQAQHGEPDEEAIGRARRRSGPNAAPSASRCGPGSRSRRSSIGAQN